MHPRQLINLVLSILFIQVKFMAPAQSSMTGLPFVRNFSSIDYGAGIQNWFIAQDKRGVVYFANNFGLLEFDGTRWQVYPVKNGTKIRSIAIDESGRIYIACQGDFGYFFPDNSGKLTYTSVAEKLPKEFRNFDETWNVFVDGDKVFYCTFSYIFLFEHEKLISVSANQFLELSFYVNQELYVNQRGIGLTKIYGTQLKLIKGGDFFADKSISSVLPIFNDQLLVSTFKHGIYLVKKSGDVAPWSVLQQDYFKKTNVNCMVHLRNGNYAIGTQNSGVMIVNDKAEIELILTINKGLNQRTVLSMMEDDLQNIWVGNNNGLAYVELGSQFTKINEQVGLQGTGYAACLNDHTLYAGTNTGLYQKKILDNSSPFEIIDGAEGQVYHIGKYNNELLLGHHNGTYKINGKKVAMLSNNRGGWIFRSHYDYPSLLVGGCYNGLQFFELKNNEWVFSSKVKGFEESSRVMEFDNDGYLWITHGYKGVFRLTLDWKNQKITEIKTYGANDGLPSNLLVNVFRIRDNLIFTTESGVYAFDKTTGRFKPEALFTKYLGNTVKLWAVSEDALGNIYFIGNDNFGVLLKNSSGGYDLDLNRFKKISSLLNDDLESITILKDNKVLFAAKEGFIIFDPSRKNYPNNKLKTLIRQVTITVPQDSIIYYGNEKSPNGSTYNKSITTLPYSNNSVNFNFTATSFESNYNVPHQFYLEGFEKAWSDWTTRTNKEYTNLREGSYTFHVRSKKITGEISDEAVYTFKIHAPWYRTYQAYGAYSFILLACLYGGVVFMNKRHKIEKRKLQTEQQLELFKKDKELETIAEENQKEISRLEKEKLEAELYHLNKELGSSTAMILNKNEFISKLKDHLKKIVAKPQPDTFTAELKKIVHEIEGNLSSDKDWEDFQMHFDKVHGDFSRRLKATYPNLSPQDMKLCAYLRMNLSTKEIANLLNISVRGVEISRYRLRKKIELDRALNLQDFILKF